jgi:hypothetical protein
MNRIFIRVPKIKGKRVHAQFKVGNHLTLNASSISYEKRVERENCFLRPALYTKLTNSKIEPRVLQSFLTPASKRSKKKYKGLFKLVQTTTKTHHIIT